MPFSIVASVVAALSTAKSRFVTLFLTGLLGWVAAAAVLAFWALPVIAANTGPTGPDDFYVLLRPLLAALPALVAVVLCLVLSSMAQFALLGGDVRGTPLNPIQAWVQAITHLPHLLCATIPLTLISIVVVVLPIVGAGLMGLNPAVGLTVALPGLAFLGTVALPLPFLAITDGRWFSSFTMAARIVADAFFPILAGLMLLTLVLLLLSVFVGVFVGLGMVLLLMLVPGMETVANAVIAVAQLLVGLYTAYATIAYAACVFERVSLVENAAKNR
jgi:hypothetical protein